MQPEYLSRATEHLPRITVVVPVYNGERHIAHALASIAAQTYGPLDIIVVDDGSTDATRARVLACRDDLWPASLHYLPQANRGPAAARNLGIRRARTDYITFLDADDFWPAGTLLRHMHWLLAHPAAWGVQGHTRIFRLPAPNTAALHSARQIPFRVPDSADPHTTADGIEWAAPTLAPKLDSALYRRTLFHKVGLLDESMPMSEDLDWFLRVREAGYPIDELPQVAVAYRRHDANMTNDTAALERARFQTSQRAIQRRRMRAQPRPTT